MIIFSFPPQQKIARTLKRLPGMKTGIFAVKRYPNGELHISVPTKVGGQGAIILGSIDPPDERLLSFLLLSHTLKKEGASKVVALMPYLGYCRHDKIELGKSLGTQWLGGLLKVSGVDEVITLDVHSLQDKELYPIPLESIPTTPLFAAQLKKLSLSNPTIIAPDEGAKVRAKALANGFGVNQIAYFKKKRTPQGITQSSLKGKVGMEAVIIDDILDTGTTLVSSCRELKKMGVKKIVVMVTHGLFTGNDWEELWNLGVERIYTTDTIPHDKKRPRKVTTLPVGPLLQSRLGDFVEKYTPVEGSMVF